MSERFVSSEAVIAQESQSMAKTFARQDRVFVRGEGVRLFDKEGRAYLDFFSGHAVMNLGHGHARQTAAMTAQLQRLAHVGNLYYTEPQTALAAELAAASFGDKVMFANSGAEIVELAVKLARKWARRQPGTDRYEILTLKGSFHGRTYGALSATGQEKYHKGLEPMLPGFKHVLLNNFVSAASGITDRTCAILVEPIQGEGGVRPAEAKYLQSLRQLCDRNQLLLIFDEIQCGLGRTGTRFAYEHFGVVPDVLLLGKPLGGGLPLSALITRSEVSQALQVGDHGSTFGGNPVAAAGGLVLLEELARAGFLEQVREIAAYLSGRLNELAARRPEWVHSVRGIGLMQGLELHRPGAELVARCLKQGLVVNCTAGNVLRLLPSLIIGRPEVDEAIAVLDQVMAETAPKEA